MPVLTGVKTESERFAGAVRTYACEALMQDNKALQAGTSHHLGQNFAKAFDVQYQTADGGLDHVWSTSWGVSTRLVGGLVMSHGDDTGLICPPRLAPLQVVIVPIWKTETDRQAVMQVSESVRVELVRVGIRAKVDDREGMKPGAKYFEWEAKGVPVRVEIGPRDVSEGQAVVARRTGGKAPARIDVLHETVRAALDQVQRSLLDTARTRREQASRRNVSKADLIEMMNGPGGFAYGGYCGSEQCENEVKDETKATIRVLPDEEFRSSPAPTKCTWCNQPAVSEAVWARAY